MTYRIKSATCKHDTGKAILVESDELDSDEWIPQSCIDEDSEVYTKGDEGDLIVSDWFAEKKGWV